MDEHMNLAALQIADRHVSENSSLADLLSFADALVRWVENRKFPEEPDLPVAGRVVGAH